MWLSTIKSRLFGGERYNRLVMFSKVKISKDNPLEASLFQLKKLFLKEFLFGYKDTMLLRYECYNNFYKTLCDLFMFTDAEGQEWLNFNGVKVPKPISDKESYSLSKEVADFLIFDLIKNEILCETISIEGPYELGKVCISPDDIVIDCGANMGLFSAMASYKNATVYAFEPSEYVVVNYLSKTAKLNTNINICRYALSDKSGEMEYLFDAENIVSSHLTLIEKDLKPSFKKETVQAVSLDEFVHKNNILKVDFLKADIEGAERYMLMGARQVLKDFAPKIAICTYHLPDDPQVLREIILDANPNYIIEQKFRKMYAYARQ